MNNDQRRSGGGCHRGRCHDHYRLIARQAAALVFNQPAHNTAATGSRVPTPLPSSRGRARAREGRGTGSARREAFPFALRRSGDRVSCRRGISSFYQKQLTATRGIAHLALQRVLLTTLWVCKSTSHRRRGPRAQVTAYCNHAQEHDMSTPSTSQLTGHNTRNRGRNAYRQAKTHDVT